MWKINSWEEKYYKLMSNKLFGVQSSSDILKNYISNDIVSTRNMYDTICNFKMSAESIRDVKFHDPATIVFWKDGTKTVVKCQKGETFDPEKGLAMAIVKKYSGNKGNYYNTFSKWLPKKEEKEPRKPIGKITSVAEAFDGVSVTAKLTKEGLYCLNKVFNFEKEDNI